MIVKNDIFAAKMSKWKKWSC